MTVQWKPPAKRAVITRAEQRMDYFLAQKEKRPNLSGIWDYWFHWYRVRRADWQTRLWLEELIAWKNEIRKYEREGSLTENSVRLGIISRNVETVEDGMPWIERELDETVALATEREWRVRFPRPQTTMQGWITQVRRRFTNLRTWMTRIREEIPRQWKSFVYVIYFAYTSPGAERHLEAHLEGQCQRNPKVQEKVKRLANILLREWVASPLVTPQGTRPGYAVPLLRSEMARPPYEGRATSGQNIWQWGVQWESAINYSVSDGRVVKVEPTFETKETVMLRFELFDFDYAQLRKYNEYDVPAIWWELSLEELRRTLGWTTQ